MVPCLANAVERTMNLSIIFSYEPCKKKTGKFFLAYRKFTSFFHHINISNRLWREIYLILIELCMKREITPVIHMILESKSKMCIWSIGIHAQRN